MGAPFPCKTGHSFASASCRCHNRTFQCLARAANANLLILNDHLIDQQPDIGLAESGIVSPEPITKQGTESANDLWRNRALTGLQLAFQSFDIFGQRSNATSMMDQALGKVPLRR